VKHDAVVIEVSLNEAVTPAVHPHVPQSPEECAADARQAADAGAAIVHWHAVDAAGVQRLADAELYGAALDAMDGSVLAYPSYPVDVPDTVNERLGHCLTLRERHGMELGPVDIATVNFVWWDAGVLAPLEPSPGYDVIRNSLPFVVDALGRFHAVGLVPTVAAFDVGSTRTIAALAEAGVLDQPVLVKIFLWGSPAIGPEPSEAALDLHLQQLPDHLDVEWMLVPYGISDSTEIEALCRAALNRGGGLRIGIGDNPRAFPDVGNAALAGLAARWAADAGRPVASVADVRARMNTDGRRTSRASVKGHTGSETDPRWEHP
jgi:3-keto-5-aminohexanoate cleavage enzyme